MPPRERPRPNMDPRAKSFADWLYFDVHSLLIAIPIFIVCIVIGVIVDVRPTTILWLGVGAVLAFSAVRTFVNWLRRAVQSDPRDIAPADDV